MARVLGLGLVVMLAACPGGDDDVDLDAAPGASGLRVTWSTNPAIPAAISADARVDAVKLKLSSVRAIGDAAPGDGRTSTGGLELSWTDKDRPAAVRFADAPAGLYSRLELGSGGDDEEYTIRGQARVGGTWYPFRIEDRTPLSVGIPLDVVLAPGDEVEVPVVLDVAAVIGAVEWDDLELDGGELHVDEDDGEIVPIRAALARAFRLGAP